MLGDVFPPNDLAMADPLELPMDNGNVQQQSQNIQVIRDSR